MARPCASLGRTMIWNRTHDDEAKLCAFDLLELDGEDYRPKPREKKERSVQIAARGVARHRIRRTPGGRRRCDLRTRLQARVGRDCVQADRFTLSGRPFEKLDQGEEQETPGHA